MNGLRGRQMLLLSTPSALACTGPPAAPAPLSRRQACRSREHSSRVGRPQAAPASAAGVGPVNKASITGMPPHVYEYLLRHTREPPLLRQLREETSRVQGAHMQIAPEQGQFMALLVELLGVRKALEVGVFTGYSSLAVALALPPDGRLHAFDIDPKPMAMAARYWAAAGVAHKVTAAVGHAAEGLQALVDGGHRDSFDFAFIDANKADYPRYFELCLQLVRPGGLVAVDNALFYGRPADPTVNDNATTAIRDFNAALLRDERVSLSIVPVGDGMALCRRR